MGKIKKRKPNKNPRQETEEIIEEELEIDSKENAIQTIIDQLQAANVEEKYCGLQTFAMLIENEENLDQVIQRGLIKIISPLVLDPVSSVRNAAAGSLRNLSALRLEICDILMEQDVMTPLICYFHQFTETWVPDSASKSKDEEVDTFIQCVNLLLNLCESSDLAVKYVSESKILDIFPRYLDLNTFGNDIVISVLQCLFVVVEDNSIAITKIKTSSEKQLQQLLLLGNNEPATLLIKTLASGVVINICRGNISSLPVDVISQIMQILATTLSLDHRIACNQLSSSVPLKNAAGKIVAPKGKDAQNLQNQIESVLYLLNGQQSAVEIIANICSCDDTDEAEDADSSESEEINEDEISTNGESLVNAEDKLPPEVLEAMISLDVFDKVWSRTQLPAENVMLILNEFEDSRLVCKKLCTLQTRALLCINNMLTTLPLNKLGGVNGLYKIWVDAGKLVFKSKTENVNLLESATAVMRAALDKIKLRESSDSTNSSLFSDLALSDIEIMLTGIKECEVAEIRSNLIRMIGLLALLMVNNLNETTAIVICTITEFILEQAHKENEVWVLAEAIDTLVDLYSEDETDGIAAKVKLVEKLAILSPILKNKARQQRKLPKEYKVLVSTACSNLPRFIKYKKSRVNNL